MARPREDDPRSNGVRVRLSDAELAKITAAAEAKGWPLSAWIREATLHVVKRPPKHLL